MLYFLEKTAKIAATLGALSPNPVGHRRLGALLLDPQVIIPITYSNYFKITIISHKIYYLILEWRSVGPLAKLAPLAQTSSYAAGYKGLFLIAILTVDTWHILRIKVDECTENRTKSIGYWKTTFISFRKNCSCQKSSFSSFKHFFLFFVIHVFFYKNTRLIFCSKFKNN